MARTWTLFDPLEEVLMEFFLELGPVRATISPFSLVPPAVSASVPGWLQTEPVSIHAVEAV